MSVLKTGAWLAAGVADRRAGNPDGPLIGVAVELAGRVADDRAAAFVEAPAGDEALPEASMREVALGCDLGVAADDVPDADLVEHAGEVAARLGGHAARVERGGRASRAGCWCSRAGRQLASTSVWSSTPSRYSFQVPLVAS